MKKVEKDIKNAETLPNKLNYDSGLVRKRYGHFYTFEFLKDSINTMGRHKTMPLLLILESDPLFLTRYDLDKFILKLENSDISKIYRFYLRYYRLQSE